MTLVLMLFSIPASAGDDFAWCNGTNCHRKYYVMNVENEGFIFWNCLPASDAEKDWKLQVRLKGQKSKWKTVTTAVPVLNRFESESMKNNNWFISCAIEPNNPLILIFNWSPSNWQKNYPARIVYGEKNKALWTGSIVTHSKLRKAKSKI